MGSKDFILKPLKEIAEPAMHDLVTMGQNEIAKKGIKTAVYDYGKDAIHTLTDTVENVFKDYEKTAADHRLVENMKLQNTDAGKTVQSIQKGLRLQFVNKASVTTKALSPEESLRYINSKNFVPIVNRNSLGHSFSYLKDYIGNKYIVDPQKSLLKLYQTDKEFKNFADFPYIYSEGGDVMRSLQRATRQLFKADRLSLEYDKWFDENELIMRNTGWGFPYYNEAGWNKMQHTYISDRRVKDQFDNPFKEWTPEHALEMSRDFNKQYLQAPEHDTVIYRGLGSPNGGAISEFENLDKGDILELPMFSSFTTSESQAHQFMPSNPFTNRYLLETEGPIQSLDVMNLNHPSYRSEEEHLMQGAFRVKGVEYVPPRLGEKEIILIKSHKRIILEQIGVYGE